MKPIKPSVKYKNYYNSGKNVKDVISNKCSNEYPEEKGVIRPNSRICFKCELISKKNTTSQLVELLVSKDAFPRFVESTSEHYYIYVKDIIYKEE